jgi:hypothetical protein
MGLERGQHCKTFPLRNLRKNCVKSKFKTLNKLKQIFGVNYAVKFLQRRD